MDVWEILREQRDKNISKCFLIDNPKNLINTKVFKERELFSLFKFLMYLQKQNLRFLI